MRISDWSSDVCSSDLCRHARCAFAHAQPVPAQRVSAEPRPLCPDGAHLGNHLDRLDVPGRVGGAGPLRRLPLPDRRCSGLPLGPARPPPAPLSLARSDEHLSELQSLLRLSFAVFFLTTTTILLL